MRGKLVLFSLIMLLGAMILFTAASAETSVNLRVVTDQETNNRIRTETYVNDQGEPVIASDKGYASIRYTYASRGRVIRIELLDTNKELINDIEGYAKIEYRYDGKRQAEQSYYDANGDFVNGPDGYAQKVIKGTYGEKQIEWQYDQDGNPVGTHKVTEYQIYKDVNVQIVSQSWYDTEDKPAAGPDGYARMEQDWKARTKTRVAYYDAEGNLFFFPKAGYAMMQKEYKKNVLAAIRYFGADGELTAGPDGYAYALYSQHKVKYKRAMFYNADGSLFYNAKGLCGIETLTDIRGRNIEERYFTGENERGKSTDGYSGVIRKYNKFGGQQMEKYLNENDKLMIAEKLGYARVVITLKGKRDKKLEEYFDEKGNPAISVNGYSKVSYEYEDQKHKTWLTGIKYLDKDGKHLINSVNGYARIAYERDENNNVIRTQWFDQDGNPTKGESGVEEVRNEWAEKNKTLESYWNENGEPTIGSEGVHEIKYDYYINGKLASQSYYNEEGELTAGKDGYASYEIEYNSDGGRMSTRYYDENKELIKAPGKEYAYERTILIKDLNATDEEASEDEDEEEETEDSEEEEEETEETDGAEEEEKSESETDSSINGTIVQYYGIDDKLMNLAAGYASIERKNNDAGKVIEETYYDADGNKVNLAAGYAIIRREYDEYNALNREAYFTADDERFTLAEGYHSFTRTNDRYGNALSIAYFDADEKPAVNQRNLSHRVDYTYLDARHVTSEAWFDVDGKPCTSMDTYARIERTFDRAKNLSSERTFGVDGQPIARKAGYDEVRNSYDEVNRLIRIDYLLDDAPVLNLDRIAAIEYLYDENGRVIRESYFGVNAEPVLKANRIASLEREYDENGFVAKESYYGIDGEPVLLDGTKYHRIEREWLDARHITKEVWYGINDEPITQGDTYVCITREFDEKRNTISEKTLDPNGRLIARKAGYDETRYTYDEQNRITRIEYLTKGMAILNTDGFASLERTYDEEGRLVREDYYNTDHELTLKTNGIATFERVYDENGNVATEAYYGVNGEPVLLDGVKFHRVERTWLDAKHVLSEAWFDNDDQPMTQGDTFVKIEREFDERGNTLSEKTYGADGQTIARNAGYDEVRNTFNDKNQVIKIEYFLNGEPVLTTDKISVIEREYDEKGNVAIETYYGTAGEPVQLGGTRYHRIDRTWWDAKHVLSEAWFDNDDQPMTQGDTFVKIEREFDERGNTLSEKTYGADGQTIARNAGYDEVRNTFNEKNQVVKIEYFLNGEPALTTDKISVIEREYDEKGNVAIEEYYGTAGEPVQLSGTRYHRIDRTWWDAKHVLSEAWFDNDGQPMAQGDTFVKIEREFDEKGNTLFEKTYGADGQMIARNAGYDEVLNTFNDKNQVIKIEYFLNGEPVLTTDKISVIKREYDEKGNVAIETYYGTAGEPVQLSGTRYHRIDRTWWDAKHVLSEAWFDNDDQPMTQGDTFVKIVRGFDERGNTTSEKTYGANGQPIARNAGYDEVRNTFNDKNQVVQIEYFLDGKPVLVPDGISVIMREYDEQGFVAVESYYGTEGEPVLLSGNKWHRIDRTWLDAKHVLSEAWFDNDGQPMAQGDTFVKIVREFDERGNTTSEKTYGVDGQPIARNGGYDEVRNTFNDKNQVVQIEYFLDGKPVLVPDGISVIKREYDEQGFVAVESYYGTEGEPILLNGSKWHRIDRTWLDAKHVLSEAWFDTENQPMTQGDTFVKIEREFDERGNTLTEKTYGANGQPIARNAGYDEVRNTFNDKNQVVQIEYFLDGKPVLVPDGISVIMREYDEQGFVAVESYYGTEGEPILLNGSKWHRIDRTWLDAKHVLSEAWFDNDDQPMTQGDTFVKVEREFDERGNTTSEKTFGADGQPIARNAGYDEVYKEYNEKNQVIRIDYWINEKPVLNEDGIAAIEYTYDEKGRVIRESYYGLFGSPVQKANGVAAIEYSYDENGNVVQENYFDVNGEPVSVEEPAA